MTVTPPPSPLSPPSPPWERGVFCNRTLNLRSIHAIGYDMDYTLVHYHTAAWERRAHAHVRERFHALGWPVEGLEFDPRLVIRGLVLDVEKGNIVKANRFGFVKKAMHGLRVLDYDQLRETYSRTIIDLGEPRWVFLNTLFSLSEACIYAQLVELLDGGALAKVAQAMGYRELYAQVKDKLDATHVEGLLKREIMADPDRYVVLDPEAPLALLDQKHAGKKLMLVTNSEWDYTASMMAFAYDRFLPPPMTWRDLFDIVVIGARKPEFFTTQAPFFEVVTPDGLLRPTHTKLAVGGAYLGGSAQRLERDLGVSGDEILYVGDHMFGDVHVTKKVLRWRTALILRELEAELEAIGAARTAEETLAARMKEKEAVERALAGVRLAAQRQRLGYGPDLGVGGDVDPGRAPDRDYDAQVRDLRARAIALDGGIAPMAKAMAEVSHPVWGLLTRAGNDKSHLARQLERYADIYTSRVSNFLALTPFAYLRSPRGSLPHDPIPAGTTRDPT